MFIARTIVTVFLLLSLSGCVRTFHPELLNQIEQHMSSEEVIEILGDPAYRYTKGTTDYYIYTYQASARLAQDQLTRESISTRSAFARDDVLTVFEYAVAMRSNRVSQVESLPTTDSY